MKKTIIFYVRLETQFFELARVYILLASTPFFKQLNLKILFEDISTNSINRMANYCKENNINFDICKINSNYRKFSRYQKIKRFIFGCCGGSSAFLDNLFCETNYFFSCFLKENVKMLFVGEDGVGITPSIFRAAKQLGIYTITIPYEYSGKKQVLESIISDDKQKSDFQLNAWASRIVFFLLRKWKTNYGGETYLRLPKYMALSMIFFDCGPKLPWSVNGGYSLKLFCDSQHMKDFYLDEGISRKKIKLTGNLGHDHIFSVLKKNKEYFDAYENASLINKSQIRILFAFPPDYTASRNNVFQKYEAFIDCFISFSKISNLIVPYYQVHPAVTEEQKKYIESQGVKLETENIVELIPKIDVLITSVSSIIRLAIALRKPVVNFDIYHFDYPDYLNVSGVKTINSFEDFKLEFSKIATDLNYVDSIKQSMKPISDRWAMLDGKVSERILSEIKECISE